MSAENTTFDVAVVGIGHQGLIAACLLARHKKKVVVLDVPSTVAGGGPYDVFADGARTGPVAHMPVPLNQEVAKALDLESRGFTMTPAQSCSFSPMGLDAGDYLFASASRTATEREISKYSETDALEFMALADDAAALAKILDTVADTLPPYDHNGWKDLWGVFETGRLLAGEDRALQTRFAQLLNGSLERLLDDTFESEQVKGFLGIQSTVGSLTPANRAGSAAAFIAALLGTGGARPYRGGWQPVRGSLHELMKALTQTALDLGVTFLPGKTVKALGMDGGQLAFAEMNDNTRIAASVFIADANPLVLFDTLIGTQNVAPEMMARLKPMREKSGFVRLKMVVSALPRFACLTGMGDESFLAGDILIAPSLEYLTKARLESRSDGMPSLPAVSMVVPSIVSPELAPQGKHVISFVGQPFVADMEDTPETRNAIATSVVRAVESFAPGFQHTIENIAVYLESNVNRTLGPLNRIALGGGHPLVQLFAARFGHHGIGYDMPFANLHLCGYGAESSASAHINRGGETAALAALHTLG